MGGAGRGHLFGLRHCHPIEVAPRGGSPGAQDLDLPVHPTGDPGVHERRPVGGMRDCWGTTSLQEPPSGVAVRPSILSEGGTITHGPVSAGLTERNPMTVQDLYDRLAAGVNLDDDSLDAGIRVGAQYEPLGGFDSKIYPAIYPGQGRDEPQYLTEKRYVDGVERSAVVVDARQSQANRCEEGLQAAIDNGDLPLPHLRLDITSHGRQHRITSLTAPHRSRDAYFRDATKPAGGGSGSFHAGVVRSGDSRSERAAGRLQPPRAGALGAGSGRLTSPKGSFQTMSSCDCAGALWPRGWAERSVSAVPTWNTRYRYGPAVRLTVRFPGQYSRLERSRDVRGESEC